jgi:phosphoribosylanthranilate isomerase
MIVVKICGITNLDDALAAIDDGADALGFNFYPPSPRYVQPVVAKQIIDQLPETILTVGVFVNQTNAETIATQAGVKAMQLHGDESPSDCASLRPRHLIKALSVGPGFDPKRTLEYDVDEIMLDASDKNLRGGTGRSFDWSIARTVRDIGVQLFLAGGLSPENVKEAIELVKPYGVDACSALESSPGKKDHTLMAAFLRAVRS